MKKISTFLFFALLLQFSNAQLLITEISYNPPESGQDSLEYIEIYNAGSAIDVTGYRMEGVTYDFPSITIGNGEYHIIAVNPSAFFGVFGMDALKFDGGLSNGGEDVSIRDENDEIVHEVDYDTSAPWPGFDEGTAGGGSSIVLCDFDTPSEATSWKTSQAGTGIFVNGNEIKGSPGFYEDIGCFGPPSGITVTTDGLAFVPKDITINVGETITFYNGGGSHNANGSQDVYPDNPEGFTSGSPSSSMWEYAHTFNIAGLYDYQCDLHVGAGMVGTVTVLAAPDDADLRITEVFYNSSITPDSLEFIEVYNAGDNIVSLDGYHLVSSAIESTFDAPSATVASGEYIVLCKNSNAFEETFGTGINIVEWGEGTLSNAGDNITLTNSSGEAVIAVSYGDSSPWPDQADGFGSSIILCNPLDEFNSDNVKANFHPQIDFETHTFYVSPGEANYCSFDVIEVSELDNVAVNTSIGQNAILEGTVYGINFRPDGLQFTLIDGDGDGIGIFSNSENFGYTVNEGDEVSVRGYISQFNGLSQLNLEGLEIGDIGVIDPPTIVTSLNEATESQLVKIENVHLVDPAQWTGNTFGFNVDVTDGTNMYTLRIDNDVLDIIGLTYPTGSFSVTGLGGQYDNSSPYDEGYQLFPRYMSDIDPFDVYVNSYPPRTIGEVTGNDGDGVAESLDENCTLVGVVYGINLRASGLQFTIIDNDGDGIAVFSSASDFGYTVNEGEEIEVKGRIAQYNGLTEIIPDSLQILDTLSLISPVVVTSLGETEESQFIEIEELLTLVDPTEWTGDGSTFSVMATDGTNTYEILIDNDTDLSTVVFPNMALRVRGIGSQRDVSSPYDEDYRIVPRYMEDVQFIDYVKENEFAALILLNPNPAQDQVNIDYNGTIVGWSLYDIQGKVLLTGNTVDIDVNLINTGSYYLRISTSDFVMTKKLVIQK